MEGYGIAEGIAKGLGSLANTLQNVQQVGHELKRQDKADKQQEKIQNLQIKRMELDPNIDPEHIRNITEITKAEASLKKEQLKQTVTKHEDYEREIKRKQDELTYKAEQQYDLREEYNKKRVSGDWGDDEWTEKDGYLSVERKTTTTKTQTGSGQWSQDPDNPDKQIFSRWNSAQGKFVPTSLTKEKTATKPSQFSIYKQADKEVTTQLGDIFMMEMQEGIEEGKTDKQREFKRQKKEAIDRLNQEFGYGEAEIMDFSGLSQEDLITALQGKEPGEKFTFNGQKYTLTSFNKETGDPILDRAK